MHTVVFYVSGHGFGHASRDIEVINALLARHPNVRVIVRTTAPQWLFDLTVRHTTGGVGADGSPLSSIPSRTESRFAYHHGETDTGVVQIDSLHPDIDETVRRAQAFMQTFNARVAEEAAFLEQHRASLVVADAPPLGAAAGATAGVPTVVLSNFTWDWIYSAYPGTTDLVSEIGTAYARANLGLRLPMYGGFETIAPLENLPFVARRSTREAGETRRALGLPLNERIVLISFGGYGLDGLDLDALSRLQGYAALVGSSVPLGDLPAGLRGGRRGSLLPFDENVMYAAGFRYEDLVRAVDVVVTKPGYGIIAECVANDTAMLYTSRGHFIEAEVLVAAMPRFLRTAFIAHDDLFAGRWGSHLDALLAQPDPPERPAVNGAEVAADRLKRVIDDEG